MHVCVVASVYGWIAPFGGKRERAWRFGAVLHVRCHTQLCQLRQEEFRPCAALSPYRSLAFNVISGTLASACETGQSRFTAFAISWNFVSSMPGTVACIVSAIRSITKPSPCLARRTLACVSTFLLASPALSQANENAIVKHAACASPGVPRGWCRSGRPRSGLRSHTDI